MIRLGAVVALAVLLVAPAADAANELGLFFGDYPGNYPPSSVFERPGAFNAIGAHLVLYGPNMPQLAGWDCSVGLQGTALLFDVTIYHGGVNGTDTSCWGLVAGTTTEWGTLKALYR